MSEGNQAPEQNQANPSQGVTQPMQAQAPVQLPIPLPIQPQPITPAMTPEEEAATREFVDAINELIGTTMKIVIMLDEDECQRMSKYNKPCETCIQVASLKSCVRKILRLSDKLPRKPAQQADMR
ncbi:MAG: hypothetical protein QXE85_00055 [Nitrososphaerota archaeon]